MKKQTNQAPTKLKLENYPARKKLKTGRYVAVFNANGTVKLLNTAQLLPAGSPATVYFAGIGRELQETYDTGYGYGQSAISGRFLFRRAIVSGSIEFGWLLNKGQRDEELEFAVYMGAWGGIFPEPAQNIMVLKVHVLCLTDSVLAFTVNGTEVNYQFESGEDHVMLYLRKPAGSSQSVINIKLRIADNPGTSQIWITHVERYTTLILPPGPLDTLEE